MKFTKQQAIEKHRKMWNWIANQLDKAEELKNNGNTLGTLYEVWLLKCKYTEKLEYNILHNCFCCEYDWRQSVKSEAKDCTYCPLCWGTENKAEDFFCETGIDIQSLNEKYKIDLEGGDCKKETIGLWNLAEQLSENEMYKEAAEVARQIANLPEKEDKE